MAFQTGFTAGIQAYRRNALVPSEFNDRDWADPRYRMFRYALNEAYYNNTVYKDLHTFSTSLKEDNKLYKHIRGVYNPVQRLVEAYVAKTYGGGLDTREARAGTIQIESDNELLFEAVALVWRWSNWRANKSKYVRFGANLGDVFLKVVDDVSRQQVRLEVLHPARVLSVETNAVNEITRLLIQYDRPVDPNDPSRRDMTYTYQELITPESFQTFKNGEPFAYEENVMNGQTVAEWPNPYGFVPVVHAQHVDMGLYWGASAYHAQLPKIDELNDAASLLNDQIRKVVNPLWYAAGATSQQITMPESTKRDVLPLLTGPEGSSLQPLIANIDIGGATNNIINLQLELERDAPELALHRLREQGMSGVAIRNAYSDAVDRFTEAMANYDDALIRAQRMALSIGGMRGYNGFQPFRNLPPSADALDHNIKERPIFDDRLSRQEEITALTGANSLQPGIQRAVLKRLGLDDAEIEQIVAESLGQAQIQPEGAAIRLGEITAALSEEL